MNNTLTYIGKEIKQKRIESGYSQDELASLSKVDRAQLSKIESGQINGVTLITINNILDSLNLNLVVSKKEEIVQKKETHPFVKWAGGKTQLLTKIKELMPEKYNNYYEPFVGGGALFFSLQPKTFFINDLNKDLIDTYECFTNDTLFNNLKDKLKVYENNHSEEQYYDVRKLDQNEFYSSFPIYDRAARLIYLNKACFNGLYRVNSKGFFNVPSGKKDKVKTYDEENFLNIKEYFKNSKYTITSLDFEEAVKSASKGDFVYFDPPYDNLDKKETFTSYDKDGFGKNEQIRLANLIKKLDKKGVYIMLSNHNTKFINDLYKDFNIHIVNARRNINSKGDERKGVEEVIITNYER